MSIKNEILLRSGLVYVTIIIFALIIIGKIIFLQIVEKEKWNKANTLTMKNIIIKPNRGDICAWDGRLLASSVPYYEIRMDLKCEGLTNKSFKYNIDSLSLCLSNLFKDKSKSRYKQELINARYKGERYHLIKRKVTYTQLKQLKRFPIFRLGRFKGGFICMQGNKRVQPFVNLASRTIGYMNKGESGTIVGVEGAYDDELKGIRGVRLMQKISGNVWMPVNNGNEIEPRDGKDIITTIDVTIQDVAQNALLRQLTKHNARHGCAVLMEVKTGEIKAITNFTRDSSGNYVEDYNYAIGESTEPGSTFKLPVLMVALEDGTIELTDSIDTEDGIVKYHDFPVRDSKKGGYGKITVQRVFEISSNIGISKIVTQHYYKKEQKFVERLYRMNINDKLNVEIKGEGEPYIKFPGDKLWSGISLPQMSYGYEVRLTPLQILNFYNAVANNGKMVKPKIVKAIRYHGEVIKTFDTQIINPAISSKATIKKAKKMLEGVVENGTAINLRNSNYKIAGKTGTAQIANNKYGYKYKSKISYQASFVGYFPADDPKYSCIVVINAPSNEVYYGNLVAGPVFKEIADKIYATGFEMHDEIKFDENFMAKTPPYSKNGNLKELETVCKTMNINYLEEGVNSEWVITTKRDTVIEIKNRFVKNNIVPNVKGMGLKDALFILENAGLNVVVVGRGVVTEQSLSPGERLINGDEITIKLI
ncbi:MAG: transpeptidase family protein [Bacteroidales bacterium]|nr:transpeptidase family protein [Bacteroidales bacterium]